MATKKYVSLEKLSLYNDKIQKVISDGDKAALDAAKLYADGLADNYDAAGSAASAEAAAKAYADGKDAAIQAAQKAGDDAAAAAAVADGKAVAAQGDVDALETYVGTFTASEGVNTVVKYIDAKTANIASDETVDALDERVTQAETDIDNIEKDYLKAADKTELEGKITTVSTAVDTEKSRAEGVEGGLRTDINTVMGDYLKASDKTELANAISGETTRATGVEDGLAVRIKAVEDDYLVAADKEDLQNQINLIMNNPDTKDVIDSIAEFTQYITDHGEIAEGFRADIDKNKEDIAANTKAIADHETLAGQTYATKTELANEKKALQEEIDADVKAVADDLAELDGVVAGLGNTKADKTYVDGQVEALQGVDTGLDNRLKAIEGKFGEGDDNVAGMIAAAKQEAIDAAAADATTKAGNAESAAKTYADGLNTSMNTRVEALEDIDHEHSNKTVLDGITSDKVTGWDNASAKAHEHGNKTVLDGITSDKVGAWDKAESNAKGYADGLNTAMDGRVATLESWHNNFTECSEQDINELFD